MSISDKKFLKLLADVKFYDDDTQQFAQRLRLWY